MKDLITLQQQDDFVAGVTKGLIEMGAEVQPKNPNTFSSTEFKLNTIAGILHITLYHSQKIIFTVYSRFEDVGAAKKKFNCNPHSGKYNVHIGLVPKMPTDKYVEIALAAFDCTLPLECSTTKPL